MRIGYFCMESVFSVRPLEALLREGHDVRFVLRPIGPLSSRKEPVLRRHRGFDVGWRRLLGIADDTGANPFEVAADRDIPAWLCGDASSPAVQRLVEREELDVIVVAFFNQLLKPAVFARPRLGTLNLHPSLLPCYRGPAPLFWTYRDGCEEAGLTCHLVAEGEDNGAILCQERLPLPLGTAGEDLVDTLAETAAATLPELLRSLANGLTRGTPQEHDHATRAPRAGIGDLIIDGSMPARRIFHFARGVGRWNTLVCPIGGEQLRVLDAVSFDDHGRIPGEHARIGDVLHLGTVEGIVALQVRSLSGSGL